MLSYIQNKKVDNQDYGQTLSPTVPIWYQSLLVLGLFNLLKDSQCRMIGYKKIVTLLRNAKNKDKGSY
jgi:hypothetical protein